MYMQNSNEYKYHVEKYGDPLTFGYKDFIPMFEQNMLITKLDEYIWEESCRILRDYIDKGYTAVPISVNVSRMDIYSLDLSKIFVNLTEKYNIERTNFESC